MILNCCPISTILSLLLICFLSDSNCSQETQDLAVTFWPLEAKKIIEGDTRAVDVFFRQDVSFNNDLIVGGKAFLLVVEPEDATVAEITSVDRELFFSGDFRAEANSSFTVRGLLVGKTRVKWSLMSTDSKVDILASGNYTVTVIREPNQVQLIFTICVSIIVSINTINMGCLLDLTMIKKVVSKPVAPLIGFCSQFLFMPLASYGFGLVFFPDKPSWRLGLFTLGCCPGGTGSNFWTLLFLGDVDLSVVMTLFSTVAAMAMLPLWLFTLGSNLLKEGNITVPYANLVFSLLALTIPLGIGLGLQYCRPKWAAFLRSILRPFTVVVMVILIVGGIYVSLYIFKLLTLNVIGAGISVALGGYLFGAVAAAVAGLPVPQIVAVSIETALQNPGIAFVLLQLSLDQPESDLAAVPIVGQLLMTGFPMMFVYLIFALVKRCMKHKSTRKEETPKQMVIRENKLAQVATSL